MKKKFLFVLVVLFLASIAQIHAFGVGAQANFYIRDTNLPGFSVLISPGDKFHIAANWYRDSDKKNNIGLTADFVPLNLQLVPFRQKDSPLGLVFNLGVGIFANIVLKDKNIEEDKTGFKGGIRAPVGFSFFFAKRKVEIFSHVAPSYGVRVVPGDTKPIKFHTFTLPIALGARVWF